MHQFKDSQGRTWDVSITIGSARRVRDVLGVDLVPGTSKSAQGVVEKLMTDPYTLCDVVYVLCKPQADQWDITDEQFGEAMAGDTIDHATAAVLEELVDFFPNRRDRQMARKALEETNAAMERMRDRIEQEVMPTLTGRADREIEKAIEQMHEPVTTRGGSSTKSRESPA